jgi:hypothetical protein
MEQNTMSMNSARLAGAGLIFLGLYLNIPFSILAIIFDYPSILREPTGEILKLFKEGGTFLIGVWYAFALAAVSLIVTVLLLHRELNEKHGVLLNIASTFGIAAGIFQAVGLIRWVFVVPAIADAYTAPDAHEATRESAVVVFNALHQYAGVAIGEHLGQLFTAVWLILVSAAIMRSDRFCRLFGVAGSLIGGLMVLGLMEGFATVIRFEVGVFALFTPLSFVALAIWMVAFGTALIWQTTSGSLHFQRRRFDGLPT